MKKYLLYTGLMICALIIAGFVISMNQKSNTLIDDWRPCCQYCYLMYDYSCQSHCRVCNDSYIPYAGTTTFWCEEGCLNQLEVLYGRPIPEVHKQEFMKCSNICWNQSEQISKAMINPPLSKTVRSI